MGYQIIPVIWLKYFCFGPFEWLCRHWLTGKYRQWRDKDCEAFTSLINTSKNYALNLSLEFSFSGCTS